MSRRDLLRPGTVIGVLAALLAAGATVAVWPGAPRPSALRTTAIDPSPDVVAERTPAPLPTPTALPTALPTPVTTTAPPTSQPLPVVTGSPAPVATQAPPRTQGHWVHTEKGVRMEVTMTPAYPRAGELVTYDIRLDSDDTRCCASQILFGDDQGAGEEEAFSCEAQRKNPPMGHATFAFHHGYRRGGTYTPWISAMASCSEAGPVDFQFKPTIRVADGPLLSNGPVLPWVIVADSVPFDTEDANAGQWFQGGVTDHDGFVTAWTWSWGDGTTTVVARNPETCHWPKDGGWIEWQTGPRAAHRFPSASTYDVTLTGVTAGCDGRDRQTVSTTFRWTVQPDSPGAPVH